MRAARPAAYDLSSRASTATLRARGSVSVASRSAIASLVASMPRWTQRASRTPAGPNAERPGGSNRSRTLSSCRATTPDELGGWLVTVMPRYVVVIGSPQVEAWGAESAAAVGGPVAPRDRERGG